MSVRVFRRPPRVALPPLPRGEVQLQPPPNLPRGGGAGQAATQLMFFLPMMLGMGAMSFFYIGRSSAALTIVFGVLFVVLIVGMVVMVMGRAVAAKKAEINNERRDYLRYLANTRKQVRQTALEQRRALLLAHPEPEGLVSVVSSPRLWERRRGDRDALHMRVGRGPQRLATPLLTPQTAPLEDLDPVASTSLRHFVRAYATVNDLPVAVAARSFAQVVVEGDRAVARDLARAWLAHLVSFHSPDDLRVCVHAARERVAEWDWLKWVPHAQHPVRSDAAGPVRLFSASLDDLVDMLATDLEGRTRFARGATAGLEHAHLVVVLDVDGVRHGGPLLPEGGLNGVTVVDVTGTLPEGPAGSELRLVVEPERLGILAEAGVDYVGKPDRLDVASAHAFARRLAPIQVPRTGGDESSLTTNLGLPELLGLGDPRALDTEATWAPRPARDRLRIPVGLDPRGLPVELDLKESAEGGMGPHGLVIGATGSGKSELLRTLVIGLAATHSSQTLNFVLVDFKGGATFAGLSTLPHTSAVITNLADDLALVDRMREALQGELIRRQELLKATGNYASARDYERAREAGAALDPLPTLLVFIDEFSELLSNKPDFIEVFVMIGRLGRSLGVHLLLASQRLDEGRLRGLDSHLSYRVGLRTFSAGESRTVLGVPDAYELPPVPGSAFLKADTATLIRFKAAYVSGVLPEEGTSNAVASVPAVRRVVPFGFSRADEDLSEASEPESDGDPAVRPLGRTVLDAMVSRLEGQGPAAHQVWLPPLGDPPSLDRMLPPLGVDAVRGLCPAGWPGNYKLSVPVGIVDKPFEQRRDLLWANLAGAAGNAIVVGAPRSGRSTMLRTLVASLALTHTPTEVQVYCLDFGGGALATLADLPHVGSVATRRDEERCRGTVAQLMALLERREREFPASGIDSMTTFRGRYAGSGDGSGYGDVFLVVDGWLTLRQEYENLEEAVTTLAARGLGYGIHVVLSANRWMDVRPALRDTIATRFELRLGEPSDSEMDRRAAVNVPADSPGRGLGPDKRHFLTALPRIDGRATVADLADGVRQLVTAVAEAWAGEPAPRVSLLPRRLDPAQLPPPDPAVPTRVAIGQVEQGLEPAVLDFGTEPHLLVYGDGESGKTGLLRLLAGRLTAVAPPERIRLLVADYRRGLVDVSSGPHVVGYGGTQPTLGSMVAEVAEAMRKRLPGPEVTAAQLRERNWWTGPELFVLVDDYELISGAASNPLAPLVEFLPQARDIGLHLVVTRRSGGAGRAHFDPLLGRLREVGSMGLVLSGHKEEGVLIGDVKPGPQPPGRGWLVRRREGAQLVQLAWAPPPD
ncbi:MAG: type VII secretion protein EccCa [Kineosporiaceae bacterium]